MKANLIPIILNKSSKFKRFLMQNVKTTRNSLTINPLEEYSITSPTVINANTLIKQGAYGYIGGDTEYLSYDFGLKIAGSSVECPMKVCRTYNTSIIIPTGTWSEEITQANIDLIKTQDGNARQYADATNGNIAQVLIELDLTPVANSLYGGSNSALKSALKSIQADVWASGYGSNTGVQTYGFQTALWSGVRWGQNGDGVSWYTTNSSSSITKNTIGAMSNGVAQSQVNTSNKLYVLVASQYASDGTIASSVSLDYINIGIQLTRTPDVINPINVSLPKYFAMVGGFSPNFSNSSTLTKTLFRLYKDSNNYIDLICSSGVLTLRKNVSGSLIQLASVAQTFSKNQGYRFIVGQTSNGMVLRILKSTGTMETYSNANTQNMQNSYSFYMEQNEANSSQGDCFIEKFTLLDLNKLGRTNGFSDAEALSMLKGIKHIKDTSLVTNGDFSQGTTGWGSDSSTISVSNNVLSDTGNGTSNTPDCVFLVGARIIGHKYYARCIAQVTNSNCTSIRLNNTTGNYVIVSNPTINTWYTLSGIITVTDTYQYLVIKHNYADSSTANGKVLNIMQATEIDLTALFGAGNEPTQAQCDTWFSQGSNNLIGSYNTELFDINSVSLQNGASILNNSIFLDNSANGTGKYIAYIAIPVLPNNKYELKDTITGNGYIDITNQYNNIVVSQSYSVVSGNGSKSYIFTTGVNTNKIILKLATYANAITTHSNISLKIKM